MQSSLEGHAKQILSVDDTYESLYDVHNNRFENKRLIVNSHIKSLLTLDSIPFESAEKLRMLIDSVLKHVRALKVMKFEINNLSKSLLMNIISQKLDKRIWNVINNCRITQLEHISFFLQDWCQILENIQGNSPQIKIKPSQNKIKNFVLKSSNVLCNLCKKKTHELHCEILLKMSP